MPNSENVRIIDGTLPPSKGGSAGTIKARRRQNIKSALKKMKPGQHIIVCADEIQFTRSFCYREGIKYESKKRNQRGYRVWKVA